MSDSGTDSDRPASRQNDGERLSPAALAQRVALSVSEEAGVRGSDLPVWNRLSVKQTDGRMLWWVTAAASCMTLGLLVIAALRVLWHDGAVLLTWLNAFTLYIYLPASAVLIFATCKRLFWLATASAIVVACHIAWVAPDFRAATPFVTPANDEASAASSKLPTIRIYSANLFGAGLDSEAQIEEIVRIDPDVIVVAEIHRTWLDTLLKSDILKTYRYGTNLKYRHGRDISVFSRLPVSRMQLIEAEERVSIAVDIPLGDETLRLFCVHSPRPRFGARNEYAEFWQEVVPTVAAEPRPLVMLGDFNATQHSLVYKQLAADGLRSAHEDRGRGYATTWPNGRRPVPPIRIDQALLSADVECISINEGEGPGSDHKPLILEIRVHAAGPRGGKS